MRKFPKAAVPMLENGEISRWFTDNGWNFPVQGTKAKGVAGVQQFFETMGLSKPPVVAIGAAEIRVSCSYTEHRSFATCIANHGQKWVYGERHQRLVPGCAC